MTRDENSVRHDSTLALVRRLPTAPAAVVDELVARLWRIGPAAVAIVMIVGATVKEVLPPGPPRLSADSALFQHAGWYMTVGGVPYVDIFDIKPPLAVEIPAVLSLISDGDPVIIYLLSVITTGAAVVLTVALAGTLVHELTDDPWAALITGTSVLAFPVLFWYPAKGFRPKIFVLAFGFAAIALARRDRPIFAGALGALAAGTWQFGLFFPIVILGFFSRRWGRLSKALAGIIVTTGLVVAPIVLQGGAEAMLVESIIVPITVSDGQSLSLTVAKAVALLAFAMPLVILGVVGVFTAVTTDRSTWWIAAGVGWFLLQVALDLDWYPDLFALTIFAAIGVGLTVGRSQMSLPEWLGARRVFGVVVVVLVANSMLLLTVGPFVGFSAAQSIQSATDTPFVDGGSPDEIDPRHGPFYNASSSVYMNELYWTQGVPPHCHYRLSTPEQKWLERTNRTYRDSCGVAPERWQI